MSSNWRAIIQIDCPSKQDCVRFANIPVLDPVQIAVVAEQDGDAQAVRLYKELCQAIAALSPSNSLPSSCSGPRLLDCMARSEPACFSLLVVVGGSQRISKHLETLMQNWCMKRLHQSAMLPILSTGVNPTKFFSPQFNRLGVLFNPGQIELLVPDVLRAARIGGEDRRLFISYRRKDAQELAEQLFDAFSHAGFRVFLDRFQGTPGRYFPRELAEELADKGMVLVIESINLHQSPWTIAEVAFAYLYRLGLVALAMPRASSFSMIPTADRYIPNAADWNPQTRLTHAACQKVVDFVRSRYALQVTKRRIYLENLLNRALANHGLRTSSRMNGVQYVQSGGGSRQGFAIHLSTKPPQLADARRVTTAVMGTSDHPVLFGPHGLLPPEKAEDLQWLATTLGVSIRREGGASKLANSIANGRVPP